MFDPQTVTMNLHYGQMTPKEDSVVVEEEPDAGVDEMMIGLMQNTIASAARMMQSSDLVGWYDWAQLQFY
jgi:hypothetical protein